MSTSLAELNYQAASAEYGKSFMDFIGDRFGKGLESSKAIITAPDPWAAASFEIKKNAGEIGEGLKEFSKEGQELTTEHRKFVIENADVKKNITSALDNVTDTLVGENGRTELKEFAAMDPVAPAKENMQAHLDGLPGVEIATANHTAVLGEKEQPVPETIEGRHEQSSQYATAPSKNQELSKEPVQAQNAPAKETQEIAAPAAPTAITSQVDLPPEALINADPTGWSLGADGLKATDKIVAMGEDGQTHLFEEANYKATAENGMGAWVDRGVTDMSATTPGVVTNSISPDVEKALEGQWNQNLSMSTMNQSLQSEMPNVGGNIADVNISNATNFDSLTAGIQQNALNLNQNALGM